MNEQIEKLAVQAFSFASAADDSDESDANWWNAYNEKFAELIIRECAGICEEHHAWTARMVGNQIKDHFGVE